MERTMFQGTCRRADGSIEVDFERQQGRSEHRIVMSSFFRGAHRLGKPLVAVVAVTVALCLMPARDNTWKAASTRDGLLVRLIANGPVQF
jgi:hypothetical protein